MGCHVFSLTTLNFNTALPMLDPVVPAPHPVLVGPQVGALVAAVLDEGLELAIGHRGGVDPERRHVDVVHRSLAIVGIGPGIVASHPEPAGRHDHHLVQRRRAGAVRHICDAGK